MSWTKPHLWIISRYPIDSHDIINGKTDSLFGPLSLFDDVGLMLAFSPYLYDALWPSLSPESVSDGWCSNVSVTLCFSFLFRCLSGVISTLQNIPSFLSLMSLCRCVWVRHFVGWSLWSGPLFDDHLFPRCKAPVWEAIDSSGVCPPVPSGDPFTSDSLARIRAF